MPGPRRRRNAEKLNVAFPIRWFDFFVTPAFPPFWFSPHPGFSVILVFPSSRFSAILIFPVIPAKAGICVLR